MQFHARERQAIVFTLSCIRPISTFLSLDSRNSHSRPAENRAWNIDVVSLHGFVCVDLCDSEHAENQILAMTRSIYGLMRDMFIDGALGHPASHKNTNSPHNPTTFVYG